MLFNINIHFIAKNKFYNNICIPHTKLSYEKQPRFKNGGTVTDHMMISTI